MDKPEKGTKDRARLDTMEALDEVTNGDEKEVVVRIREAPDGSVHVYPYKEATSS